MADDLESSENPQSTTNHFKAAQQRLIVLGDPTSRGDAIALAQVHATLALAQTQAETNAILSATARELNMANLFTFRDSLPEGHPLRDQVVQTYSHMLNGCFAETAETHRTLLADRIEELRLSVAGGDDITLSDGARVMEVLAVDPSADQWFIIDSEELPATAHNSQTIAKAFGIDIRSLAITIKTPKQP